MPKRKNNPDLQALLDRPICYYCERDFDDIAFLHAHQKAKHFRCHTCSRRLNTAGGLSVHCQQVHKKPLEKVENALPGREAIEPEVFGMEGFPADLLESLQQAIISGFWKKHAEHRAKTGNPPPGSQAAMQASENKQRTETPQEAKQRMAEWLAKKKADKATAAAGNGSEDITSTPFSEPSPMADATAQSNEMATTQVADISNGSALLPGARNASSPTNLDLGFAPWGPVRTYTITPPVPQLTGRYQMPTTASSSTSFQAAAMPPGLPSASTAPSFSTAPLPVPMPGLPPAVSHSGSPPMPQNAVPRQNSLPSHPGLPQRPDFGLPNVSKGDMAKMHGTPSHFPVYPNQYSAGPPSTGPPLPGPPPPTASAPGPYPVPAYPFANAYQQYAGPNAVPASLPAPGPNRGPLSSLQAPLSPDGGVPLSSWARDPSDRAHEQPDGGFDDGDHDMIPLASSAIPSRARTSPHVPDSRLFPAREPYSEPPQEATLALAAKMSKKKDKKANDNSNLEFDFDESLAEESLTDRTEAGLRTTALPRSTAMALSNTATVAQDMNVPEEHLD